MHSECVQNVSFTNDEWATNWSSVKFFEKLKKRNIWKQLCEIYAKTIIHLSVGE